MVGTAQVRLCPPYGTFAGAYAADAFTFTG